MSRDSSRFDPREADPLLGRAQNEGPADERVDDEHSTAPQREVPANDHLKPGGQDRPRNYVLGRRTFALRDSQVRAMAKIGTFRVLTAEDLSRYAYDGDAERMERELRRLQGQGLAVERTLPTSGRKAIRVIGLTKLGKRVLRSTARLPENQAIYHGIVKTREAKHDAALYRLFQAEISRIARAGGRPLRVVLDYELKRDLYREREGLGERRNDPSELKALAERHGLRAVNGKIPLPDLRIEYQTAEMEHRRVDLELATRHYRPRGIAEKTRAGFSLYSPHEDATRLRRILDEQELTARIFAL